LADLDTHAEEVSTVAVGVLITMPEVEKQHYDRMNRHMFGRSRREPVDTPDGLLVHSAGPMPDGWYVYEIWASREDFERFDDEQITPAARTVIGAGVPEKDVRFFEIDALVSVLPGPADLRSGTR